MHRRPPISIAKALACKFSLSLIIYPTPIVIAPLYGEHPKGLATCLVELGASSKFTLAD